MKFIKGVMSFSTKPMYTREFLYNFKLLNIDKSDIITGKKRYGRIVINQSLEVIVVYLPGKINFKFWVLYGVQLS